MAKFDYSINRYLLSKAENNLDIGRHNFCILIKIGRNHSQ